MKRLETWTAARREELRDRLGAWKGAFGLDPEEAFFAGSETMPTLDFEPASFCPSTAWWLGELCRLAYTPDCREAPRDREGRLPNRERLLRERSPFEEVLSIHKTANHASIYRNRDGSGGTLVSFRGTNRTRQWIMNAVVRPHGWKRFRHHDDPEDAFVHSGFYVLFKRIWPLLHPTLEALPRPWIFTGHSLGGALATIAGVVARPDLVCTFGSPKVGNEAFQGLREGEATWRIVNEADLVPKLPLDDPGMGEKRLIHGSAALQLRADGRGGDILPSPEEEASLIDLKSLPLEWERPPVWLSEHRMSEYIARLRLIYDRREK